MAISIAHEKNPDILRQVASLLEGENKRLHTRLRQLLEENYRLKNIGTDQLQLELIKLQEQVARQQKTIFGDSSEKRGGLPPVPKTQKHQKGHGPKKQPNLPTVEKTHDLDEPDKICPQCGGELKEMEGQYEESEEIDVVQRQFVVVKHKRKKYRCRCGDCVDTALGPSKLIPGGRYSVDFAIDVAISKYLDHLPLERQVRIMQRDGLDVDSQTLWDQLQALANIHQDLPQRLVDYILKHDVIGADETTWRLLDKKGRERGSTKWFAWGVCVPDAVVYRIFDTRGERAAAEMLSGYKGKVMTDGYAVYEALSKRPGESFVVVHCWSHVRRKFIDAENSYPREAGAVINLIDELFAIERLCTGPPDDPEVLELRKKLREQRSAPIIKALEMWSMDKRVLPQSSFGKGLSYMSNLWKGLTYFLKDPKVMLSNNAMERTVRGIAIGRKNHYGSKSRRGTEVAALFYTLVESAKLAGIEPRGYLRMATLAALNNEPVPLPHEYAKQQ